MERACAVVVPTESGQYGPAPLQCATAGRSHKPDYENGRKMLVKSPARARQRWPAGCARRLPSTNIRRRRGWRQAGRFTYRAGSVRSCAKRPVVPLGCIPSCMNTVPAAFQHDEKTRPGAEPLSFACRFAALQRCDDDGGRCCHKLRYVAGEPEGRESLHDGEPGLSVTFLGQRTGAT